MIYCRFTKSRGPPNLGNQRVEKSASPMFGKVCCGLNFGKLALQLWNLQPRYPGQASGWPSPYFLQIHSPIQAKRWNPVHGSSSVTIWPIVGSLVSVLAVLCSQRSPGSFTPPLLEPAAGSSGDPSHPLCFVPAETRSRRQQFSSTKNAMLTATELTFTVPGQNSQDQQNILRYCVRNLHLPASIRL